MDGLTAVENTFSHAADRPAHLVALRDAFIGAMPATAWHQFVAVMTQYCVIRVLPPAVADPRCETIPVIREVTIWFVGNNTCWHS